MVRSRSKIAILHDDSDVAERVTTLAAEAGIACARADNTDALIALLRDPQIVAVVLDIAGPHAGGFELLERVSSAPSRPQLIVITAIDQKTIDSTRRLARNKELKLTVFKKDRLDAAGLAACFGSIAAQKPRFGAKELAESIEQGHLRLEYQPKIPLDTSATGDYAVEALCRIGHPELGIIYPDEFIGLAESEGLIDELTDAVVCRAFEDWRDWHAQGLSLKLALNVSPELLRDGNWFEQFNRRCAEYDIGPEYITLEITESSSGTAHATALDILTRLRLKGFTLSIDDFGTGFSSLATLYKLPFSELKIDKSFTFDLQESPEARALIESTIGMAQRLGLKVCAEGVESEAVMNELRLMGCETVQGFFISKSIPPDKIPAFFADWKSLSRGEPIRAGTPGALPKIAMIQTLMQEILDQNRPEDDSTLVISEFGKRPQSDEDSTLDLARRIPSLVLQGKVTTALAHCHAAVKRLEGRPERAVMLAKVQELQRLLEHELLCNDDLDLVTAQKTVRLLSRRSALIGRPSSVKHVDIGIGCRWFSRGEKNLRLFQEGGVWFVEDLGSTNGSFIGDERLRPGKPQALPIGETLVETGKQAGAAAPVAVLLKRPSFSPNAVVMTLTVDAAAVEEAGGESQWPALAEDLRTTWVIFQGHLSAGNSEACAIVLDDAAAERAAEIYVQDGFWIAPEEGMELSVFDAVFKEPVPLPAPADVVLAGAEVEVRQSSAQNAAHTEPLSFQAGAR
jgi:EAL domain-containing protein (putative c-di-GMP-specific phosphodiesterase class I)